MFEKKKIPNSPSFTVACNNQHTNTGQAENEALAL